MTLIVYRKDGSIERVQEITEDGNTDFTKAICNYEAKYKSENRSAELKRYPDDSVEAYIIRMKAQKKKDFINQLNDISYSIDKLDGDLRWLRDELERMDD